MKKLTPLYVYRYSICIGYVLVIAIYGFGALLQMRGAEVLDSLEEISEIPATTIIQPSIEPNNQAYQSTIPSLREMQTFVKRPLFNEDRLPLATETNVEVKPSNNAHHSAFPGDLNLMGVVLTDEQQVALVKDDHSSELFKLNIGNSLPAPGQSWVLATLHSRSAVFQRRGSDQTVEIRMDEKK
ncbi:MAG: hypothetical protein ACFHVJ_11940 [Aestuariibacter sp.]